MTGDTTTPRKRGAGAFYVRGLPADLRASFKAYCARRGYTIQDAVAAMMRDVIQGDKALVIRRPRRRRV